MSDESSARARILDAALEEFASRGYEAASTNAIAAKAGVAKGLVFHHFESKEALCETLFDREAHRFTELVFDAVGTGTPDLFERLSELFRKKVELAAQHPLTSEFLIVAVTEAPPALRARLTVKQAALAKEAWPRLLAGLDASRLKPGVALGDAVETLSLLAEGLERQLSALLKAKALAPAEIGARMWRHFERLRDGLYRD